MTYTCRTLDLTKLTAGLSTTWAGLLADWDRSLRAGNYPATTRYNYLLAAVQLALWGSETSVRAVTWGFLVRGQAACR
jgi:hypothetical protein